MEASILESIGVEIIGVMSPVSICMLLVVLLVYSSSSSSSSSPIRTAANLVYLESPSDPTSTKLEGALINALVFVLLITLVTFLLVLLYYYNFTNFLKNYMRFSALFVLATMGGSIFLSLIQRFSIPLDSITCSLLLFNFSVVGVLSVFSPALPILVRQSYMVSLGVIVAAWFSRLPEWTTWVLLLALALYDLVAVLAPRGPLKMLVDLASTRDEDLPALVYEARPAAPRSNSGLLVAGVSDSGSGSVELQAVPRGRNADNPEYTAVQVRDSPAERGREEATSSPLMGNPSERVSSTDPPSTFDVPWGQNGPGIAVDEERSPLVELLGMGNQIEQAQSAESAAPIFESRGIKLGLGDFVFYSVLVGRAAMYDLMTVYACYLAIISGLGCTLILLSVCRRALPALPISITLGILFYFLTRLLMEPFVVGTMTNLMMF